MTKYVVEHTDLHEFFSRMEEFAAEIEKSNFRREGDNDLIKEKMMELLLDIDDFKADIGYED